MSAPDSSERPFVARAAEFVRFSHTVFALPFALMGMLVAAGGWPPFMVVVWILVCMVSARTAAMAFNRVVDWELDKTNPRTEGRHRLVSRPAGKAMIYASILVFFLGCWNLNLLCVMLCPVALALILFYSLTKRFTSGAHFFLGLALAVAPMGAWAAVTGELYSLVPYILSLAVLLWVAGFDLIYATQDAEHDRKAGLHSIPARFGIPATLRLARGLHVASAAVLAWFGLEAGLGWVYGIAWLVAAGCLVYEHRLSASGDLGLINKAFFQVNAVVGISLLAGVALHYLIA
jgi:4-hydroxybenzoate polyprenyltransferase